MNAPARRPRTIAPGPQHHRGALTWSAEEDAAVRRLFVRSLPKLQALLPHRSLHALRVRASRLGVRRLRRWTAKEITLLRREWGELSVGSLARKLRRSRDAVTQKAIALGLSTAPQGWVSITAAARHLGVNPRTVHALCQRHGLKVRARTLRSTGPQRIHRGLVCLADLELAVGAEDFDLEPLSRAAERVGMSFHAMRRWCTEMKVRLRQLGPGRLLLVRSADADRVARAFHARYAREGSRPGPARCTAANDGAELSTSGEGRGRR